MVKIIYYYQTFCGLDDILHSNSKVTHIHLSSVHFGIKDDMTPYIHLNDNEPDSKCFDSVWKQLKYAQNNGIKIILMLGGAGGAYSYLFSDFDTYYKLLKNMINQYDVISGIDLDIEESVELLDVKKLINKIKDDFGQEFSISMAPLASSLMNDEPGMGGFSYKDLYNSDEGEKIDYFNGQFYGDFSIDTYIKIIDNKYPASKIVMGMLSELCEGKNFTESLQVVSKLKNIYQDFGGVFVWEYSDCPPDKNLHNKWSEEMANILNNNINHCIII